MAIKYAGTTKLGRRVIDRLKLKIPVFGKLGHKICLAKFSRTLSTLLVSGVPILQAMETVAGTVGNEIISEAIMNARARIREGDRINEQRHVGPGRLHLHQRSSTGIEGGANSTGLRIGAADNGMVIPTSTPEARSRAVASDFGGARPNLGSEARKSTKSRMWIIPRGSSRVSPKTGRREWPAVRNRASSSLERRIGRDGDDVGARHHHVGDADVVQPEHVLQDRALLRREVGVSVRALERVLDIVAHRACAQAEQAAQPLEQIALPLARSFLGRALDLFDFAHQAGARNALDR